MFWVDLPTVGFNQKYINQNFLRKPHLRAKKAGFGSAYLKIGVPGKRSGFNLYYQKVAPSRVRDPHGTSSTESCLLGRSTRARVRIKRDWFDPVGTLKLEVRDESKGKEVKKSIYKFSGGYSISPVRCNQEYLKVWQPHPTLWLCLCSVIAVPNTYKNHINRVL